MNGRLQTEKSQKSKEAVHQIDLLKVNRARKFVDHLKRSVHPTVDDNQDNYCFTTRLFLVFI